MIPRLLALLGSLVAFYEWLDADDLPIVRRLKRRSNRRRQQ